MAAEAENKASLFWNCSMALQPEAHTHKLLKSYYMNMCRKYIRNAVQIPKEKFAATRMCSHCGSFWSESDFKLKLKSQHITMKGKTKRLIEKLNTTKEPGQRGSLSGKQRKRAKWLQKRATQYMEIKCDLCQHISKIKMEKPKNKPKKVVDAEDADVLMVEQEESLRAENDTKSKVKKKKKNKNKLAGLKLPLEMQQDKKPENAKTPQKPQQTSSSVVATPKTPTLKTQPSKSKKKNISGNTTNPSNNANKVVSKTQQQNSLLQLAALLKKNSTSNEKTSAQKRLESLLK
ncbi:uncharacterized protein LOC142237496 [Haematobia irritans]|uniref:uncharacterized protein LOC142237496 n=1 Tax=Haematobia irritans TaxID=7368 RepID=UPI003F4F605C